MFFTSTINQNIELERKQVSEFLKKYDVEYDNPEHTVVIRDKGKIIATGSVDDKVLKYLFIDDNYKGQGLMVEIYNALLDYLLKKDIDEYFVFTKPKNEEIFTSLGLEKIVATDHVLLLEGGFSSYETWVKSIEEKLNPEAKTRGAIVANCNPMTLGHKYLIEKSADRVDELIVFIVEEDKSFFSTKDRFDIVKEEFKDRSDIVVVLGGAYIISQATFPTYFLKKEDDNLDIYTKLDAKIFAKKIASDLNIDYRFVGEEPLDGLTNAYNQNMQEEFSKYDLELVVIKRKEHGRQVISASRVRSLLDQGLVDEALELLPKASQNFIQSGGYNEKSN